jgi:hypothetical protein
MLKNRKISGTYEFSDGGKIDYVGSYEKDFLQMLNLLEFKSTDIMGPSPHTYSYTYENKEHFYIPDYYLPNFDLEIEIKDNQTTHHKILEVDKVKERLKDEVMKANPAIHYVKLVDKSYEAFFQYLIEQKEKNVATIPSTEYTENTTAEEAFTEQLKSGSFIFTCDEELPDITVEDIAIESANYTEAKVFPVFVLLIHGGTIFSNLIRFFTGGEFTHASLSLDSSLKDLYTFGQKNVAYSSAESFDAGFVKESISDKFHTEREIPYALYALFVDAGELALIRKRLGYFIENKDNLKYHLAGCVKAFTGLSSENATKFFCSAFVADVLNSGKHILTKSYSLMKPMDLAKLTDLHLISTGLLSQYSKAHTDKVVSDLMKSFIQSDKEVANESTTQPVEESTLTTEQREDLKDSDFGLPEARKYPLNDEEHVRSAISYFRYCPLSKRKKLAEAIKKAIIKFNMETKLSDNALISKYL